MDLHPPHLKVRNPSCILSREFFEKKYIKLRAAAEEVDSRRKFTAVL